MPDPNPERILAFATSVELSDWLKENHHSQTELWIRIFKKGSKQVSVNWDDVVIEALCWGWIDGIKKSIDEQAYLQRITPRKTGSNWSKRNRDHVERLLKEGRMQEAGIVHVRAAQADGRWQNAYTASEMQVPDDFLTELTNYPEAEQFYESLSKSSRYVIAYGLTSAKRPVTRDKRFAKYLGMLQNQTKPS